MLSAHISIQQTHTHMKLVAHSYLYGDLVGWFESNSQGWQK